MKQVDLVLAFESAGKIQLWSQLLLLFELVDELGWTQVRLFRQENGTPWTSAHFRGIYVLPLLQKQAVDGDNILKQ
jgi:hypothetical protein